MLRKCLKKCKVNAEVMTNRTNRENRLPTAAGTKERLKNLGGNKSVAEGTPHLPQLVGTVLEQ